jgi:hypothetical protein
LKRPRVAPLGSPKYERHPSTAWRPFIIEPSNLFAAGVGQSVASIVSVDGFPDKEGSTYPRVKIERSGKSMRRFIVRRFG